MQLHTKVSTVAGVVTVTIDGAVDLASVGILHNDLARALRRHPGVTMLVDLDATTALDDAGLGVLLGAAAAARQAGGDLEIVCTEPLLRERLERTRFDRAVSIRAAIA